LRDINAWKDVDLRYLLSNLDSLRDCRAPEKVSPNPPADFVRLSYEEAKDLLTKNPKYHEAAHLAEQLIPVADENLEVLQAEGPVDLCWTRSLDTECLVLVHGNHDERERELGFWIGERNNRRDIQRPWKWMQVSKLPKASFWCCHSGLEG
jgi:hypothetical protein